MRELHISYNTFKTICSTYNTQIYYVDENTAYSLYMSSVDFIYLTKIFIDEDKLDFETNLKPTSISVNENDDAIALASPVIKEANSGCTIATKSLYVEGKTLTITAGASSNYVEWTFDTVLELQGGDGQVVGDGATFGDYVNFGIYHPIYGEIYRFATNIYLYGNDIYDVSSNLVAPLSAGLSIRMTYYAVDTNGRNVICRLRGYK